MFLNGDALEMGRRGEEYSDDSFLLLFNAHPDPVTFTLPGPRWGDAWQVVRDTTAATVDVDQAALKPDDQIVVDGRSMVILCRS